MMLNLSTLYAGPLGSFGPGVCEVPDAIATGLIEAGVARPVVEVRAKAVPTVQPVSTETESVVHAANTRRGSARQKST